MEIKNPKIGDTVISDDCVGEIISITEYKYSTHIDLRVLNGNAIRKVMGATVLLSEIFLKSDNTWKLTDQALQDRKWSSNHGGA